jgi:hypothetical protein
MTADRLNSWLALGANIGVLIGLGLLIVELNQTRDVSRAQTRHDLSAGIVELLVTPALDSELASIMRRADAGEPLTPDERYRFLMRSLAFLRYAENVHYQYREGMYDDHEFEKQLDAWRDYMTRSKAVVEIWCDRRSLFSDAFVATFNNALPASSCESQ